MKRITCILVAVTLAIPVAIQAQSSSYIVRGNDAKTDFIQWVEQGINNGKVLFDTPEHKAEFLDMIQDVYNLRDAENWADIVSKAEDLKDYTQYILVPTPNHNKKELAESLCEILRLSYLNTSPELFGITPSDENATTLSIETDDHQVQRLVAQLTIHHVYCNVYKRKMADGSMKDYHAQGCEEQVILAPQ